MQPLTNAHTSACPKCGAATAATSKTCSACGAPFHLNLVFVLGSLSASLSLSLSLSHAQLPHPSSSLTEYANETFPPPIELPCLNVLTVSRLGGQHHVTCIPERSGLEGVKTR
ncbi:hypothetical protein LX32DRAFT_645857 [Colletotrichum zoysiae]|uniref:Zinc-ribbon domain-containing protein n=1 Tax=Colletotrichum zoysiae TaxID=1216348 RepID=A0AAD9H5U7_9PEZI|nr:hypothetical protein LX32DRAFT_645857 [Colletotrichum zoysiae]